MEVGFLMDVRKMTPEIGPFARPTYFNLSQRRQKNGRQIQLSPMIQTFLITAIQLGNKTAGQHCKEKTLLIYMFEKGVLIQTLEDFLNLQVLHISCSAVSSLDFSSTSRVRVWGCRVRVEYESSPWDSLPKMRFESKNLVLRVQYFSLFIAFLLTKSSLSFWGFLFGKGVTVKLKKVSLRISFCSIPPFFQIASSFEKFFF